MLLMLVLMMMMRVQEDPESFAALRARRAEDFLAKAHRREQQRAEVKGGGRDAYRCGGALCRRSVRGCGP
jgi:hypothetical protein